MSFFRCLPALCRLSCATLVLLSLVLPAFPHEGHLKDKPTNAEVEKHRQTDFGFKGFDRLNVELQQSFEQFSNWINLAKSGEAAQRQLNPNGHIAGSWSPLYQLPLVPIHVMLLPNGKVLMWDSVGDRPTEDYPTHNFTRASVWDPVTNIVTNVDNDQTGHNLFCAGFAHLPDGTPFLAGGNKNSSLDGIKKTHFFAPDTNTWSLGPDMQFERWYPSVTPLANGEMLITSGGPSRHEVYATNGTIRTLSNFTHTMPIYPWIQAAPNGKAFLLGPEPDMYYIDPAGAGSIQGAGWRVDSIWRYYGSYAMYDIGRVIASGGWLSQQETVKLDFRDPSSPPTSVAIENMDFGRRQHNLTALPDGSVLSTGGLSSGASLVDLDASVFRAELMDPETGEWRALSDASRPRQYHSTALLLPDGRVLTGGGGICGDCYTVGYLEKNMEIFTPPYLYDSDGSGNLAPRPDISNAPSAVDFDEVFTVGTPDPGAIEQVVMMRVSSVTHSVDFEQRRIPLEFSVAEGGLSVKAPRNANIAPPGYYMLFLIDENGVPSVAEMVKVEYGAGLGSPMIVKSSGGSETANISWIPVPGATGYRVKYGLAPGIYTTTFDYGSDATSASFNGLPSWRYYFAVSAVGPGGEYGNSNEQVVFANVAPTAAPIVIGGRIIDPDGRGLSGSSITVTALGTGVSVSVVSNSFGHYLVPDIPAGRSYIVSVKAKGVDFPVSSRVVSADDNVLDIDFIGTPVN